MLPRLGAGHASARAEQLVQHRRERRVRASPPPERVAHRAPAAAPRCACENGGAETRLLAGTLPRRRRRPPPAKTPVEARPHRACPDCNRGGGRRRRHLARRWPPPRFSHRCAQRMPRCPQHTPAHRPPARAQCRLLRSAGRRADPPASNERQDSGAPQLTHKSEICGAERKRLPAPVDPQTPRLCEHEAAKGRRPCPCPTRPCRHGAPLQRCRAGERQRPRVRRVRSRGSPSTECPREVVGDAEVGGGGGEGSARASRRYRPQRAQKGERGQALPPDEPLRLARRAAPPRASARARRRVPARARRLTARGSTARSAVSRPRARTRATNVAASRGARRRHGEALRRHTR